MPKIKRKSPLGAKQSRGLFWVKDEVIQIWPYYISIDCKFYVLSEKYENHVLKTHRKAPPGQHIPMGLKYEGFYTGSCYISIRCKFCVLSEKQKNYVLKIKHKLPQSQQNLPCLGAFLSPCLTTSIPVRNLDGRLIDRDFKITHHLFRCPLPCNDWLSIAQSFR